MAVNRRLLAGSLGVAAIASVAGGYALSQRDTGSDDNGAGTEVRLDPGAATQEPSIAVNRAVEGDQLPDLVLVDGDGNQVRTSALLGQPLILNVWYSTCAPCKKELPAFAAVHADFGDDIRFVGVNPFDTAETNASFAHDRGVTYELLRDVDGAFTDAMGIATAPVTLFVSADGTIVDQTGVLDEAALREHAAELLA